MGGFAARFPAFVAGSIVHRQRGAQQATDPAAVLPAVRARLRPKAGPSTPASAAGPGTLHRRRSPVTRTRKNALSAVRGGILPCYETASDP